MPKPKDFVANLDVRCFETGGQPPLNISLRLDQLNPAFGADAAVQQVIVREAQELCLPVYKNGIPPPSTVLPFMQYVDWSCYKIDGGRPLDLSLRLDHLNPNIGPPLSNPIQVVVKEPEQLCLPVRKDAQVIPPDVLKLIQWLDVECFRVETPQATEPTPLTLHHLNPLYSWMTEWVNVPAPGNLYPIQLCVPVMKDLQGPTDELLEIIRYSDVLCYQVDSMQFDHLVQLTQLNPVVDAMGVPPQKFIPLASTKMCLPVAKNGFFPPG
ncbi:MAG TPA: hypothetical protein VN851_19895 [Thermoanaerobaculia bacterium]|nr:hypothetical protein [Thermoanaerobaculia bacterium]